MQQQITTSATPAATQDMPVNYVHVQVTTGMFERVSKGWRFTRFGNNYGRVEYLNSPSGLIVLAHQDTNAGQIDGIHPASLSGSITSPRNIIEPFRTTDSAPIAYNLHWMTRRSQGALIHDAFGRMVDSGDPEANSIETPDGETMGMAIYDAPFGPVIALFDSFTNDVFVILEAGNADFIKGGESGLTS